MTEKWSCGSTDNNQSKKISVHEDANFRGKSRAAAQSQTVAPKINSCLCFVIYIYLYIFNAQYIK